MTLFTDASINPELKSGVGGYLFLPASYLFISPDNIMKTQIINKIIFLNFTGTSSSRLELQTVLAALAKFQSDFPAPGKENLVLFTDSQLVTGLLRRRNRLESNNMMSMNTGTELRNAELYGKFYEYWDEIGFEVIKVKGHSSSGTHNAVSRIFSCVDRSVRLKLKHGI